MRVWQVAALLSAAIVSVLAPGSVRNANRGARTTAGVSQGARQNSHIGPRNGALVVVGGGLTTPEMIQRFVSLAGGPGARFVLIPTADTADILDLKSLGEQFASEFGVRNVVVLHTRDRMAANSEAFVAPLRSASGVWFDGGRQWRLTDAYLNTRTEREIRAVLERGGVIGGSSAGATIQGSYLVRGDPKGNSILMSKGHEKGFGYLENVAIDQHVLARHREKDLSEVVKAHPELLGIGIDESTAIVVKGDRFEVIGESKVAITDGKDHCGAPYYLLSRGDRFNLRTRAVE